MKVLFVVINNYPNGDAGAVRQHAFATILHKLGHEVTVLCVNQAKSIDYRFYEGIQCKSIKGRYFECKNQLKEFFAENCFHDIIFLNAIPLPAFYYVKKYSLKNKITLVHDCVEWYSLKEFSLLKVNNLIRGYIVNSIINKYLIDKNFKVVSISSFLHKYFLSKGISSIRVPVIMNSGHISPNKLQKDEQLKIMYAGSPSKKDYLKCVILALEKLSEFERKRIIFNIYGINEIALAKLVSKSVVKIQKLGCITAHGRVPREDVLRQLEKTDFTILIRPKNARYAKAGFPTKVVESLTMATPVITNITSDLGMYLIDEVNSLIIKSEKADDILDTIRKALALSIEEKNKLSFYARQTAEKYFNTIIYENDLGKFIES